MKNKQEILSMLSNTLAQNLSSTELDSLLNKALGGSGLINFVEIIESAIEKKIIHQDLEDEWEK